MEYESKTPKTTAIIDDSADVYRLNFKDDRKFESVKNFFIVFQCKIS